MTDLMNTGERILLEIETPLMIARHFSAYRFAKDYASNKQILDIGCGEGYGTHYLSGFAREAVGVDYDEPIINYAKNKYQKENLSFYCLDIKSLSTLKNKFDIIYAFQVIEHLREPDKFLRDVNNLLKEDGIFICSTPNKLDASPNSAIPLNRFHVKEYLFEEFKELMGNHFSGVEIFSLKRGRKLNFYRRLKKIGIFKFLPDNINPVKKFYDHIESSNFFITKEGIDSALDFITVCKK